MRSGTLYAKKLKKIRSSMRKGAADRSPQEPTDPVEQLVLAVLSEETTMERARKAHKRLMDQMIDYNELRVSGPAEISEMITGIIPRNVQRGKALVRVLNAVYQREYSVTLDSLRDKGIRDIKQYLDSLEGSSPYVTASVVLWSMGGHAIPLNALAYKWLQRQELVHPSASHAEVQSFLERHISAADARDFSMDLESMAARSGRAGSDGIGRTSGVSDGKKSATRTTTSKKKRSASASGKKSSRSSKKKSTGRRKTKRAKK